MERLRGGAQNVGAESDVKRVKLESENDVELRIPSNIGQSFYTKSTHAPFPEDEPTENVCVLCVRNLPEWTDPEELKNLFTSASTTALESALSTGLPTESKQIVTNVHVVRDPDTAKCVGYAYVEFTSPKVTSEVLSALSGPDLRLPGSNKVLTLERAKYASAFSNVLSKYHFYIGNLRPGLTDRFVLSVLQSIHPGIISVRLVPQECLGLAPIYVNPSSRGSSGMLETDIDLLHTSTAFYCAQTGFKVSEPSSGSEAPQLEAFDEAWGATPEARRWSCGFVRLHSDSIPEWKAILLALRAGLNSLAGKPLRRPHFTCEGATSSQELLHPSIAIVARPLFGKFYFSKKNAQETSRGPCSKKISTNVPSSKGSYANSASRDAVHEQDQGTHENKTTVFVANLAEDERDESLATLFSPFGIVLSLRIAYMKRVAFVELGDHRSALAALSHLRGAFYHRCKLQMDWGRSRVGWKHNLPKHIDAVSVTQHSAVIKEKAYAAQWLQSMQPQISYLDVAEQSCAEKPEPSENDRRLWLASLCMSLPKPTIDLQGTFPVDSQQNVASEKQPAV